RNCARTQIPHNICDRSRWPRLLDLAVAATEATPLPQDAGYIRSVCPQMERFSKVAPDKSNLDRILECPAWSNNKRPISAKSTVPWPLGSRQNPTINQGRDYE